MINTKFAVSVFLADGVAVTASPEIYLQRSTLKYFPNNPLTPA